MKELPEVKFKVEGHTDNRDKDSFNLLLSKKRADAVVKYLRKRGIKAERLTYKGYGETRPKYSNETKESRRLNRRVEIHPENVLESDSNFDENERNTGIHIVKANETLYSIANKYNTSIEILNKLNDNTIKVGQKLKIKE
jgi:hypothetical protein